MKKYFNALFILSVAIFAILSFSFIPKKAIAEESIAILVVDGCGKIEASADSFTLGFNINHTNPSFDNGLSFIKSTISNLSQKIKELNSENEIFERYNIFNFKNDQQQTIYEFSCDFYVKAKQVGSIEQIVSTAYNNGVQNYYGCDFSIQNTENLYNQAILLAKEDASKKAQAISSNATLRAVVSTHLDCQNCHTQPGKMTITAHIKCIFTNDEQPDSQYGGELPQQNQNISKNNFF